MNKEVDIAFAALLEKAKRAAEQLEALRSENAQLKHTIATLNVEKSQILIHHKEEKEEQEDRTKDAGIVSHSSIDVRHQTSPAESTISGNTDVHQLKKEVMACIEELDSCIHLIQSRE